MYMRKILISFLLAPVCAPLFVEAQSWNVPKYQLGLGVGGFVYMGDLSPSSLGSYKTTQPGFALSAARLFSPSFSLRANLAIGSLRGDEAKYDQPEYRAHRAFAFKSSLVELSVLPEWNILRKNYESKGFAPYVFAGAGISFLSIKPDASRLDLAYFGDGTSILTGLQADEQQRLPRAKFVLPVGIGMRYYINDTWGVQAETSYRFMNTDYLDGFSQSVNPGKGDAYHSHFISLIYRIGKKDQLDCPPLRY